MLQVEFDALGQRQIATPVDGASLATHVTLPGVGAGLAATAGFLLATESATDLGTGADTVLGQIAAEVLGVPEGTVKSRCSRGRAKLALALAGLRNPDVGITDQDESGGGRNPSGGSSVPSPPGPSPDQPGTGPPGAPRSSPEVTP